MSTPLDPFAPAGFGDDEEAKLLALVQTGPLIDFTILGQPYSKSNRRRMVKMRGRMVPIKSKEAETYAEAFAIQVPRLFPVISGELAARIHIAYASELPDTDESLILDLMQVRVIANDRQIRHRLVTHEVDPENPRCRVKLWRWPT